MADLMEVSTKAEYAPYLKTLTDVATEVVEGRVMGRKLEFHEGNWELSDKVDNGTIDMASNGYGWSMNFQRALDVLSERQFESVNCSYRENLQNARDAKPNSGIFVQTMQRNEGEGEDEKSFYSYAVIEDGKGMSVSDLGEYLFNIFSSSKSGESDFAGEHGIGFISNLAYFETVVVDTKTEGHEPMTIVIKGKYDGDKIRPNRYDIDVLPGHRSINGSTVLCLEKA
ncbi:ATP-binding protein [archaeon]|nr:ATP-binding protein [archaeon]